MSRIKKLPDEIVSKIAAGEVIEKPVFAVKELIENSLDAKATSIKIEIKDAGLEKIAIYDNGVGMSEEDLLQSYKPYTTSKIFDENDLLSIKTLGFRGEALSSIAAISTLTIQSKTKDSKFGTKIVISNSKFIEKKSVGMTDGTAIIIENLFSNVPARKKFLNQNKTEYRYILETIINFAISHPKVSFEFVNNNKTVFKFSQKDNLTKRLEKLFGKTIFNNLIPFSSKDTYIKINGFLSKPQTSHYSTKSIHIFVNNRTVTDPMIINSIKESYSNLLENNSYPFVFLYMDVPCELVDVNIHPRKELIKFNNPSEVSNLIQDTVLKTLVQNNLTFHNVSWSKSITKTTFAKTLKKELSNIDISNIGKINKKSDVIQIHNLYLLAQTKNGVMFIDQHAAHEAILYRKLQSAFINHKNKSEKVNLKKAQLINVSLPDAEIIKQYFEIFDQIGFEIEEFGDNIFRINAVPKFVEDLDAVVTLSELIDDLKEGKVTKKIDRRSNKMLAFLACRSAIKSGQALTKKDIKKLINELNNDDFLYTCPHGRPVKIEVSLSQLDKIFKRH